MATPQEEKAMRDRVFTLLMSPAAQRIDFFLDRLHVDGDAFRWVAGSLVIKQLGFKGIGVRFGQVAAGGDASYDPNDDVFDFPAPNYGLNDFGRHAIIHEAVHAWLDLRMPQLRTVQDAVATVLRTTTAATDEAAAYVAGNLFHLYDKAPALGTLPAPFWTTDPLHGEAYRIAKGIRSLPGVAVPAADVTALKKKIMADPVYGHIKANPAHTYGNNGVNH